MDIFKPRCNQKQLQIKEIIWNGLSKSHQPVHHDKPRSPVLIQVAGRFPPAAHRIHIAQRHNALRFQMKAAQVSQQCEPRLLWQVTCRWVRRHRLFQVLGRSEPLAVKPSTSLASLRCHPQLPARLGSLKTRIPQQTKGQHNYVRLNIRPPDHPVHIKIWLKK